MSKPDTRWFDDDAVRVFMLGSFLISVFCLAYVARYRLGVSDPYSTQIFWHLLITQDYWAALLTIGVLAVAVLARNAGPTFALVRVLGRYPVAVAMVAFLALCAGAIFAYHDYPLSMDEYSAVYQSEIFAAGKVVGHFPPDLLDWLIPKPFQNRFLIVSAPTGATVSYFMPGFSLLLTPFMFLGIPWACNPAIGALSIVAVHRLARNLCGNDEAGGWAILFALASPAFVINAMSYYSMSANLLFGSVYALLLLQPRPGRAFAAGLIGGFAIAMHSPPPHLLFAFPWVVWLVARRDFPCLGALAAGYIPGALGLGAGWLLMLNELRHMAAIAAATVPGTGAGAGGAYISAWLLAIAKIVNVPDLNTVIVRVGGLVKLWLWAVPGLPLLAVLGFLANRGITGQRLLLASAVTTFLGYCLIPFDQGHGWGYRYFHTVWSVLPVMAASAMVGTSNWVPSGTRHVAIVGTLALCSLILSNAMRVTQVESFIGRHLAQVPLGNSGGRQVAFIDTNHGYYTVDMIQNHPGLKGNTVIMVGHGSEQNAAMARRLGSSARRVSNGDWGELWLLD